MPRQVYVLDQGVQDVDVLLAGVPADAQLVRLDAGSDGIWQLATALAGLEDIEALHVLSHGAPGALLLGNGRLDSFNIDSHAAAWAALRAALGADAEILLYGCDVAKGEVGRDFIGRLAGWTGARVAASHNLTGAGGDWELQHSTGPIRAAALAVDGYRHSLNEIIGTGDPETLSGTAGDDQIYGAGGADTLYGNDGDDFLHGGSGADVMNGGHDNDTYVVDNSADVIEGEEDYYNGYWFYSSGWDTVQSTVTWTLADKLENLTLIGTASVAAFGNDASNILTGNIGNNTLDGGAGNDTLIDAAGNDLIDGGDGNDTLSYVGAGAGVTVRLATTTGQFTGGAGTDTITNVENVIGSAYADVLIGDNGTNLLLGNAGDDLLNGGVGSDTMDGGSGNDRVTFVGLAEDFQFGWRADGTLGVTDTNPLSGGDYGNDALRSIETLRFNDRDFTMAPGGEFRVNTTTVSSQSSAKITTLPSGGFVVTWQSFDPAEGRQNIFAQVYDAAGAPRFAEIRVNKEDVGGSPEVAISALEGGGFVIAWNAPDGNGEGIWMRRFNALGAPIPGGTGETLVNSTTTSDQLHASIAALDDGGFVIAWHSLGQPGDEGYAIVAQRYNASGVAQGSEIAVNQYTTSYQANPSVTATGTGDDAGFVVSWQSYQQDGSDAGVYARHFDLDGVATGNEYLATGASTLKDQFEPEVAGLADGGSVVVWRYAEYNAVTFTWMYDIWAQRFDANGVGQGEFMVHVASANTQVDPAVAALEDGGFVIVWRSDAASLGANDIFARRYNAAGAAVTGDLLVNSTTAGYQSDPDVSGLPDGGFVVTWSDFSGQDGSGGGVFARRFDANNVGSQPVLQGSADDDFMDISGDGDLVAAGGAGDDTYRVNSGGDVVRENADQGEDTIETGISLTLPNNVENLVLLLGAGAINGFGNALANELTGNGDANVLVGYGGNDTMDGGAGADTMYGYEGDDVYYVDNSLDAIGAEYSYYYDYSGFDTVYSSADYTLSGGLNDLILSGAALVGYGSFMPNVITGTAGNNSLSGSWGDDTLIGGAGSDTLDGGPGQYYWGGNGHDVASYADANAGVTVDLNVTDPQVTGGSGTDKLVGIENLIGSNQADTFTGNADTNYFQGRGGSDALSGGDADDTLDGGTGADTLAGGAGNDLYLVDGSGDQIEGEVDGTDLVQAAVSWTLGTDLENLVLTGAAAINGTGNESGNSLSGNNAANNLSGFGGDDQISGGGGNDVILGGDGADVLAGNIGTDQMTGGLGNDTINGGVGSDTARFAGNAVTFQFGVSASGVLLVTDLVTTGSDEGTDSLRNIDSLHFNDQTYTLRGGELQLNTTTVGSQQQLALAGRADGGFVAVWQDYGSSDGHGLIYGQRVDANGVAQGAEFRVDTGVDNVYRTAPDVAVLASGGYVVTWQSWYQDGDGNGIYAQRYSAAGVRTGDEFRVSTATAGHQENSSIAALADGDFVVTWESVGQDGSGRGIYAQRYTATGVAVDAEFRVNTTTADDQLRPQVAALDDGGFVVVWSSYGQNPGGGWDVYAQRYNADGDAVDAGGTAAGTEFLVNTTLTEAQDQPVVAGLTGGGFAIAWESYTGDPDYWEIVARVYDADGDSLGEVPVNTTSTSDQLSPAIAALNDGGFAVTWNSWFQDGSSWGVFGQRFNASGVAQNGEFQVNTYTSGVQAQAEAAQLATGGFVAGWYSEGQDGSEQSVHAQRFDSAGTPRPIQVIGTGAANTIDLSGPGALTGVGGAGNDIYVVNDNLLDRIIEIAGAGQGNDTVRTGVDWTLQDTVENLVLLETAGGISGTGNSVANALTGNSASNTLSGGAGNDTIASGGGIDQMSGGFGNDVYIVNETGHTILESASEGADTVRTTVNWLGALAANVENVVLLGGADIDANGNSGANTLTGNGGANALAGAGGNDTLTGGAGPDALSGGAGDDTYYVDANDTLTEGSGAGTGTDTVRIASSYVLQPNFENLVLTGTGDVNINGTGNGLANELTGNAGDNLLNGGLGADTMTGGAGDDSYRIDNAGDSIVEAAAGGYDNVISTATSTLLAPQVEELKLLDGSLARNGTGNAGNNLIIGNEFGNDIDGGIGADTMEGGDQNDHYKVDNAGDVVTEESGDGSDDRVETTVDYTLPPNVEDLLLGGTGNISGTGNSVFNELTGNSGNNVLDGKGAVDIMTGGAGNDTYYVDLNADSVIELSGAGEGIDTVFAATSYTLSPNIERLFLVDPQGGASNYEATGNGSNNLIEGGAGDDELNGLGGNDTLRGLGGDDTLLGGDGIDLLEGGVGADSADGGAGVDSLVGADGNDTLDGGAGADALVGGTGNDTYQVDNVAELPVELDGEGIDEIELTLAGGQTYTLGAFIERVLLAGITDSSVIGNGIANIMLGNSGANTISGAGGDDYIEGGQGFDSLFGGIGDDTIYGGVHDVLTGDIDTMIGGAGDDVYYVDNSADIAGQGELPSGSGLQGGGPGDPHAAAGSDIDSVISLVSYTLSANIENLELEGGADLDGRGNDLDNLMTGNTGDNLLSGREGSDIMNGGAGNDTLDGGADTDIMSGGAGNDVYILTTGDTITSEGSTQGVDTVQSSTAITTLFANIENVQLTGTAAVDASGNAASNTLTGNSGANILRGNGGTDTLLGQNGADKLIGGAGKDTMTGGAGADIFVFDSGLGTSNIDTITDFVPGVDKIQLDLTIFNEINQAAGTTLGAGKFFATNGNTAHLPDDRIIYNTSTGALFYDPDGTGALGAIKFAQLSNEAALQAADIVLIA